MTYTGYTGGLDYHWKNPPAPFNPLYDPKAKDRYAAVTASLEADGFYKTHTREECKEEWRKRYEDLKERGL